MCVYDNLKTLGIELPSPPPKGGTYAFVKQTGNLVYTSGHGPEVNGVALRKGKLGKDLTIEEGQEEAKIVILNTLATMHATFGDLNRIKNVVKILGFIASDVNFTSQPIVMNAASKLLIDIFGNEKGEHARSAIGTSVLPNDIPVEIEVIFEIE